MITTALQPGSDSPQTTAAMTAHKGVEMNPGDSGIPLPKPEEALFANIKTIITKHITETQWLQLPLYLTLVDEPSEVIWQLRLDSLDGNFMLLDQSTNSQMKFPVEVFVAQKLYPDEMIAGDKFVQVYAELTPAGNNLNSLKVEEHPMHIAAEIEASQRDNFRTLGWQRYDWAGQPPVVRHYRDSILKALKIGADIVINADNGAAYVLDSKSRRQSGVRRMLRPPQTLVIDPVSQTDMEHLRSYIRTRLGELGEKLNKETLTGAALNDRIRPTIH